MLYCDKSDWFYSIKFDHLKQYFIRENRSEEALNHYKLCEIAIRM